MNETVAQILVAVSILTLVAIFVYLPFVLLRWECASKWELSGMATSYGPIQGCLIQHDGRWIPEQNYRELP